MRPSSYEELVASTRITGSAFRNRLLHHLDFGLQIYSSRVRAISNATLRDRAFVADVKEYVDADQGYYVIDEISSRNGIGVPPYKINSLRLTLGDEDWSAFV